MVNLLPAVLVGGPPHAGKSVLFYSLTKTLHERGIHHHAIRACPDGEGNWFHEIYEAIGKDEIRQISFSDRQWTEAFVNGICADLERRHLPFLVDMGGRPRDNQLRIFLNCTHSILLLKPEEEDSAHNWQRLIAESGLTQIAELRSELDGTPSLDATSPIIRGTITGLDRKSLASGPVFDALVDRLTALFSSYSLDELEQAKLAIAPVQFTVNLDALLHRFDPAAYEWRREMLPNLVSQLPTGESLAVYSRGPVWLYSMLAAQVGQQPFYQFDPRIGWLAPPTVQINAQQPPPDDMTYKLYQHNDAVVLSIRIVREYLDYLQADNLPFPPISPESGLIIDGRLPYWLLTALVRLYQNAGMAWIACHQPKLRGAVVVMSRVPAHALGDLVAMPPIRNDTP
jgi:CRISPR-associated protein Csx3